MYTAHSLIISFQNIISYQFWETMSKLQHSWNRMIILSAMSFDILFWLQDYYKILLDASFYFWAFWVRGVLSPTVNGYPFFWLQHLCFDVFLSFNYWKGLLHLSNWGPYGEHLSGCFPVGCILDMNSIALRATPRRPGHASACICVPWTFYVHYAKTQVMRSIQSKGYSLHLQLLIKPKFVPWYHMIGICVCVCFPGA